MISVAGIAKVAAPRLESLRQMAPHGICRCAGEREIRNFEVLLSWYGRDSQIRLFDGTLIFYNL